jgi:hypothetical protein
MEATVFGSGYCSIEGSLLWQRICIADDHDLGTVTDREVYAVVTATGTGEGLGSGVHVNVDGIGKEAGEVRGDVLVVEVAVRLTTTPGDDDSNHGESASPGVRSGVS